MPPPKQKPTAPSLPLQSACDLRKFAGHQVLDPLLGVLLGENRARLVLVAGVAADGRQRIRREGDVAHHREAARDVLDVRVEPAVLVYHHHAGQLAGLGRAREIALHRSRALRRRVGEIFGPDPLVVLGHLLRPREVGAQGLQHRRGAEAADRVLGGAVEELPAAQSAVHIAVEQLQHFLGEIGCFHAFHGDCTSGVMGDE
jgi:hypothetical protein